MHRTVAILAVALVNCTIALADHTQAEANALNATAKMGGAAVTIEANTALNGLLALEQFRGNVQGQFWAVIGNMTEADIAAVVEALAGVDSAIERAINFGSSAVEHWANGDSKVAASDDFLNSGGWEDAWLAAAEANGEYTLALADYVDMESAEDSAGSGLATISTFLATFLP